MEIVRHQLMPTADRVEPVKAADKIKPTFANRHMSNLVGHNDGEGGGAVVISNAGQFINHCRCDIQTARFEHQRRNR